MKIAVGIPSLNEKENIRNITLKIDEALSKYKKKYDVVIVNCDNNSTDGTNKLFCDTNTECLKDSIITKKIGKGNNLLAFFNYCFNNNVDYAITIDADVTSFEKNWITKFLKPLFSGYDYVTPIYKRSRYEGSTTNHFAFPLVYAITGKYIRQPIAGDFSFNRKFINIILKQPVNESICHYGIDIFMSLNSLCNNLKIQTIILSKKIHNPSFHKMEGMFYEVMDAFIFTWKRYYKNYNIVMSSNILVVHKDSIISSLIFNHKEYTKDKYNYYRNKIGNIDIESEWLSILSKVILNPTLFNEESYDKIFSLFMVRATSFWLEASKISSYRCEELILNQAMNLRNIIIEEVKK